MKTLIKSIIANIFMIILSTTGSELHGQNWLEKLEFNYNYNLTGKKILTIVSNNFNYEETIEMSEMWKSFGAEVDYTASTETVTGEEPEFIVQGQDENIKPSLKIETLLKDISSLDYDVMYIAGGEGIKDLVSNNENILRDLINSFAEEGKIIAAICHGPLAFSVSGYINGKKMTANGEDEKEALMKGGAIVLDDIIVFDAPFITGQWPFLETFCYTLAEKIQFAGHEGPFEKYMGTLNDDEKVLGGLRAASELTSENIDENILNKIIMSAMLTPPMDVSSVVNIPFRFVRIDLQEKKNAIVKAIFNKIKDLYTARGMNVSELNKRLQDRFVVPSNLFLAVIDTSSPNTGNRMIKDSYFKNSVIQYGSAREIIVIMSKSFGLNVCFSGYPAFLQAEADIKKIINIPDNFVVVDIFSVGHAKSLTIPPVSRSLDKIMLRCK